jgi:hypothetical protein
MLESSLESVTSALKRARASLQRRVPSPGERDRPPAPNSPAEEALVAKFVRAYESGDIDALVAMLTADVLVSMPPIPLEYQGLDVAARLFAGILAPARRFTLVPTRANGQPAFGTYLRAPTGMRQGRGFSSSPSLARGFAPSPALRTTCSRGSGCRDPSPHSRVRIDLSRHPGDGRRRQYARAPRTERAAPGRGGRVAPPVVARLAIPRRHEQRGDECPTDSYSWMQPHRGSASAARRSSPSNTLRRQRR